VRKRSAAQQAILSPTVTSSITIDKGSNAIRPFAGYLTIPGLRSASFLSLAERLGWVYYVGCVGYVETIVIGSTEDVSRIKRLISDWTECRIRDSIGNKELLGNPPGAIGVVKLSMLGISKSGSCSRTTSLNNLFASVFGGNPRTVWGRSCSIGGNKANGIAGRVC
jgi:hypothetical protein